MSNGTTIQGSSRTDEAQGRKVQKRMDQFTIWLDRPVLFLPERFYRASYCKICREPPREEDSTRIELGRDDTTRGALALVAHCWSGMFPAEYLDTLLLHGSRLGATTGPLT